MSAFVELSPSSTTAMLIEWTQTKLGHTRPSAEGISQDEKDDCDNQEDLSEIRRETRHATETK
jgi:hypothetical protein